MHESTVIDNWQIKGNEILSLFLLSIENLFHLRLVHISNDFLIIFLKLSIFFLLAFSCFLNQTEPTFTESHSVCKFRMLKHEVSGVLYCAELHST